MQAVCRDCMGGPLLGLGFRVWEALEAVNTGFCT